MSNRRQALSPQEGIIITSPVDVPTDGGGFLIVDYQPTQKDADDVSNLVSTLLTLPRGAPGEELNWGQLAAQTGMDLDRVTFLRRLPLYQKAMKQGLRLRALEGVGKSIQAIEETAMRGGQDGVRAFSALEKVASVAEEQKGTTFIKNQQNVQNVNIEARLKDRLRSRVQAAFPPAPVVDVEEVEEEDP